MTTSYEPPYDRVLQSQALLTVFSALGGMSYGGGGGPAIVLDDIASLHRTEQHIDPDGTTYVYTTNVTVSVSKVAQA